MNSQQGDDVHEHTRTQNGAAAPPSRPSCPGTLKLCVSRSSRLYSRLLLVRRTDQQHRFVWAAPDAPSRKRRRTLRAGSSPRAGRPVSGLRLKGVSADPSRRAPTCGRTTVAHHVREPGGPGAEGPLCRGVGADPALGWPTVEHRLPDNRAAPVTVTGRTSARVASRNLACATCGAGAGGSSSLLFSQSASMAQYLF